VKNASRAAVGRSAAGAGRESRAILLYPHDVRIVAVILAPALLWLVYHVWKDRQRPEPVRFLLVAYVLGIGAGWLGLHVYEWIGRLGLTADPQGLAEQSPLQFLVYALLVVGPLEEAAKFLPFALVCLRLRAFDEEIDGVVYASAVALGFASFENFVYMRFLEGVELFARAVASPITHALFASIWGYASARAKLRGTSVARAALLALVVAALAHGLYDFLLLAAKPWVRPVPALIILAIWIWRMRLVRGLQREQFTDTR
jgi:RsiW-degrading membrane proteinase PrsW (M82 family)